ncbi:hypothetical protein [Streptomyces chartreusis]|uniref:hypothetical protein n=1 Tax=Streptomyces chartreusis TaxID=1969 RepID=UPI00123E07B9|nr:hypothetical protein [Streptomyces chartreusis]GGX49003.1 hypothetical protein GCM10010321_77270 [Streptomyces chartreusis]
MTDETSPISDRQVKHLEMIQAIVTRLGNGSFLIKGWTMTLAGAFLGFAVNRSSWKVAAVAVVPLVGFWILDSYYLRQERLFRALYEAARKPGTTVELFSMNTSPYRNTIRWRKVVISHTMVNFYGLLVVVMAAVAIWWYVRR